MIRLSSYTGLFLFCLSLLLAPPAFAAEVTVTNSAEFQLALQAADHNTAADIINLAPGEYSTSQNSDTAFTYFAQPGENQPLTIRGAGAGSTFIQSGGSNSLSLLKIDTSTNTTSDNNATIVVEGITFRNSASNSGAEFVTDDAAVTVKDCTFTDIFNLSVSVSGINGGSFTSLNSVYENSVGSGVDLAGQATVLLEGNEFNNMQDGGARISAGTGDITLRGNTLNGSPTATASGFFAQSSGELIFEGNTVLNNVFDGASAGGAFLRSGGPMTVTNNIIAGNSVTQADSEGGGLFIALNGVNPLALTNNTITGNSCTGIGGGILVRINNNDGVTNIYNNIIFGNNAGVVGGDIAVDEDFVTDNVGAPVNVFNNDFSEFSSICQVTVGCVPAIAGISPVDTNIHADPLFKDAAGGDFHLSPGSPAIGKGNTAAPALPAVDIEGNPLNSPPDLGALAAVPALFLDPASLDFGNLAVNAKATRSVTVSNNGARLQVSNIVLSDTVNYSVNLAGGTHPCGSTTFELDTGESCTLEVTFSPQSDGTFNATLNFSTNDPNAPGAVVTLVGIGGSGGGGGGCALGTSSTGLSGLLGFLLLSISTFGIRRIRRHP